jgi:hypothetical protein
MLTPEQRRRLATEVMGWHIQFNGDVAEDVYCDDRYNIIVSVLDYRPDEINDQAVMLLDELRKHGYKVSILVLEESIDVDLIKGGRLIGWNEETKTFAAAVASAALETLENKQ